MTDTRRHILVTGGAGYIGSHACKALHAAGFIPVCFDSLEHGYEWAVQWGPLEQGTTLDEKRLDEVFERYRPLAVIHFAAYAYVGESVEEPEKYYQNNVAGTLSLLSAMRRASCNKLVFSSTCATYGIPETLPITESTTQHPINPYGVTKLTVEGMLRDFEPAYGLSSVILRYFNAAGADPDGELGEAHDPETHLIPLVLDVASGQRESIKVFGTDYPTHDGTCIRDYIHVTDLAEAHVLSLRHLLDNGQSRIYNLGNGAGYSVLEVIQAAEKVTGVKIRADYCPRRPGDPASLVAGSDAIKKELSWKPAFDNLDDILGSAWSWHQKRLA